MGPKARAAIRFPRAGGRQAVITTPEYAATALREVPSLDGRMGTRIIATSTTDRV